MGRWHPIRSALFLVAGLYGGVYISQQLNLPPVAAPMDFVAMVTAVYNGADPFQSLDVIKKSAKWFADLKQRNPRVFGAVAPGGKCDGSPLSLLVTRILVCAVPVSSFLVIELQYIVHFFRRLFSIF